MEPIDSIYTVNFRLWLFFEIFSCVTCKLYETDKKVRGHPFKVGPRYKVADFIGEGAYGVVVRAQDIEANENDNLGKRLFLEILENFHYTEFFIKVCRSRSI